MDESMQTWDGKPLIVGQTYIVKQRGTGKMVNAKFISKHDHKPFGGSFYRESRGTVTYHFENLATGRTIMTRSRQVIFSKKS